LQAEALHWEMGDLLYLLKQVDLPEVVFDKFGNYYFWQSLSAPRIRMIDTAGIITTVAGNGVQGYSGDNGPANAAKIYPQEFDVDSVGNIYIADRYNNRVRKVDVSTHIITTIAGNGILGFSGDGGPALQAEIDPLGICVDRIGNLYIIDGGLRVRKIDTGGTINTIAGSGNAGYSGDGGPALNADLMINYGIEIDTNSNIYLACESRIRKINLNTGLITTIAGNGNVTYIGDGMHADSAQFSAFNIGIDLAGNVYIADIGNDRVYMVGTDSIFHKIAGTGVEAFGGDGGNADTAKLFNPEGIAVDKCGNVYIADDANNRIRKVTYDSTCSYSSPVDTTDTTTAIHSIATAGSISIYPNPAKQQITISGGGDVREVMILNTIGQVLIAQKSYSNKAVIDVSALGTGIYFIKVIDSSGAEVVKRFLKE